MPPRIPAANELIADKRCYVWHGVLPTTSSHTPGPLPPLGGLGPSQAGTPTSSPLAGARPPAGAPKGRAKRGHVC